MPDATGLGTGDVLNPPLIGSATGSLLPLGNVAWSDMVFPNLATGAGDGTFKMTFIDGDTLFGTLHEQGDCSTFPIVPFTQLLTVTGGTGALLLYHGTLIGIELSNQIDGTFTSSGGGTTVGFARSASGGAASIGCMEGSRQISGMIRITALSARGKDHTKAARPPLGIQNPRLTFRRLQPRISVPLRMRKWRNW